MTTQFVIFDDGSVRETLYTSEQGPQLPAPGRVVGEAEYREALAGIKAAQGEHWTGVLTEERKALRADYEALRAAGIPEVTARRLASYTVPEEDAEG